MATEFEHEVCSRCGGTGNYSYCQMYGTTCFKCHGRKSVLTKRGEAAVAYRNELRKFPVEQIQAGWLKYYDGFMGGKRGWHKVIEVRNPGTSGRIVDGVTIYGVDVVTEACTFGYDHRAVISDVAPSLEYLKETTAKALAYQDTLTKQGTQRIRKAACTNPLPSDLHCSLANGHLGACKL